MTLLSCLCWVITVRRLSYHPLHIVSVLSLGPIGLIHDSFFLICCVHIYAHQISTWVPLTGQFLRSCGTKTRFINKVSFFTPLCLKLRIITINQHSQNGDIKVLYLASITSQNVNLNTCRLVKHFPIYPRLHLSLLFQADYLYLCASASICHPNKTHALSKFSAWVVSFQSLELNIRSQNVGYIVLVV